jgi:cystathionine beta-lyase
MAMKDATLATTLGRHPHRDHGIVNPPIYRASTILAPTLEAYETRRPGAGSYGRYGTPTTFDLQEAVAGLEGGDGAIVVGCGKTAITSTLLALLAAGDHIVVTDSVYGPTRRFADGLLARFGVETTYVDPRIGAGIGEAMRPATKVVFVESPGSLTFEVQDVPAIAEVPSSSWTTPGPRPSISSPSRKAWMSAFRPRRSISAAIPIS